MSRLLPLAVAALVVAAPAQSATTKLVLCAPGYPGSTAEAQPSLDAFAGAAAQIAGWPEGSLAAEYHESEAGGLAALADPSAALALVAWPFYEKHAAQLRLAPIAQAVATGAGDKEPWSLVAKRGRVRSAAQLAGWEIVSLAGYAPEFVRAALGGWGAIPAATRITAGGRVLSALRRAASGEDVAVLLDGTQFAGLGSLPFAAELEVVAASPRVPVAVLCSVGTRLPAARARAFASALQRLDATPGGAAALEGLRLVRFVPAAATAAPRSANAGTRHE